MRTFYLFLIVCSIANITFAQQKEIDEAIRKGENLFGKYTAYPNVEVKQLKNWLDNNPQWMIDSVRTVNFKEYGYLKQQVVEANLIQVTEEYNCKFRVMLYDALEAGDIKKMIAEIEKNPKIELNSLFINQIGIKFTEYYQRSKDIIEFGGTPYIVQGKRTGFHIPTDNQRAFAEDAKRLLILRPDFHNNSTLKKAAFEYAQKSDDLLYYFSIFNDYFNLSETEVARLEKEKFEKIDTKKSLQYFMDLFPKGKLITEAKELAAGGLYKKQTNAMETIIGDQLKIIRERKGYGLYRDIVIDFYELLGDGTRVLSSSDPNLANYFRTANNFRTDFASEDSKNLVDQVMDLLTIIEGLWAENIQIPSAIATEGFFGLSASYNAYVADDRELHKGKCAESARSSALRLRMDKALEVLNRMKMTYNVDNENFQSFENAISKISSTNKTWVSEMVYYTGYCRACVALEEARKASCLQCLLDWDKTNREKDKIILYSGMIYRYTTDAVNGKLKRTLVDPLPDGTKMEAYSDEFFEEFLTRFIKECNKFFCR